MKRTVATAIVGLLVMISAALNLSFALRSGSLSRPPVYDDVVYLLGDYQRLAFGGVNSLRLVKGRGAFQSARLEVRRPYVVATFGQRRLAPNRGIR
jgi:hypothetical protein